MAGIFNKSNIFLFCVLLIIALEKNNAQSTSNVMITGKDVCGLMVESQMGMKDFPWISLLEYESSNDKSKRFLCSGSLIGPRHLLTSAVCVSQARTNKLVSVRLGEWNLNRTRDCTEGKRDDAKTCKDRAIDVEVEEAIAHPMFDIKGTDRFKNDIAIVKLSKDVEFTEYIRPICLPSLEDETKAGSMVEAITWGKLSFFEQTQMRQKLTLTVVDNTECRAQYEKSKVTINKSQICVFGVDGKSTSNGDGGGPLMNRFKDNQKQWYLEGILSFGPSRSTRGVPDVFTKVADYLEWIVKTVK